MAEYIENDVRSVCRDIYRQSIGGLLSKEDACYLENLFMQTKGAPKYNSPQEIKDKRNQGRNVERLQNIIRDLCQGEHPANKQIKEFLLEKGYATENNGQIEFTSSFILQTPDNGLIGGHTKSDKDGNILIVINQQMTERSDDSLAVVLGHEICHQMINDKLQKNATSSEIEALCDIVGLIAAKGCGYDIHGKIAEDEKDFSRETQKQAFEHFYSDQPAEFIEQKVNEHMENIVNGIYMPDKLKKIAEFIDEKIPVGIIEYSDLSFEDKRNHFDTRKFKGEDAETLNSIFNKCMELVKENDLGKAILDGAEYGKSTTKDNYTVEEIYIGNRGRTQGGHCCLISAIRNDKNPNNARGEIYINEDFVRSVINELGKENGSIYLSNVVVHEFLHGNQRKHDCINNKIENSRSGLGKPKTSEENTNTPLTHEQMERNYKDVQNDKKGWARMMLTEAASMTAGLTICMQLCNENNRSSIIDYAIEDMKKLGNVSDDTITKLKDALEKTPKTEEERQNHSLHLFNVIVNGEMEHLREVCGNKPLGIKFSEYEDLLGATFNEKLFGPHENFDRTIKCIDEFNKTKEKMFKPIIQETQNKKNQTLSASIVDIYRANFNKLSNFNKK